MEEKSQNDIFLKTLEILEQENILKELILVGLIKEKPDLQIRTIQIFNEFPKSWQKIVLNMVKIYSQELNELLRGEFT